MALQVMGMELFLVFVKALYSMCELSRNLFFCLWQLLSGVSFSFVTLLQKSYETKQYKKGLKAADAILKKFPDHGGILSMVILFFNTSFLLPMEWFMSFWLFEWAYGNTDRMSTTFFHLFVLISSIWYCSLTNLLNFWVSVSASGW